MIKEIISFFRGKIPRSVSWEEVRQEILDSCEEWSKMKIKFEITPYYYKVTSGKRTWYWNKDTGEFDGTSFSLV